MNGPHSESDAPYPGGEGSEGASEGRRLRPKIRPERGGRRREGHFCVCVCAVHCVDLLERMRRGRLRFLLRKRERVWTDGHVPPPVEGNPSSAKANCKCHLAEALEGLEARKKVVVMGEHRRPHHNGRLGRAPLHHGLNPSRRSLAVWMGKEHHVTAGLRRTHAERR